MLDRTKELTPREKAVFALILDGLSSKQIAARLGIKSHRTVDAHRENIKGKCGARNVKDLIRIGFQKGQAA
jgi:DNA-binding CsgD family transcriptional regulator